MILNKEQLACFESPLKASIIAALRAWGPSSIKNLSHALGATPGSLYHHVRHLAKVGLLKVAEVRAAETKPEAIYELASKEFFMRGAVGDLEYQESLYRSAKNIIRLAQRHYERTLSQLSDHPELENTLRFNFVSARLSQDKIAQLKADMEDLLLRALTTHDPDGQPVMFVGLLTPTSIL